MHGKGLWVLCRPALFFVNAHRASNEVSSCSESVANSLWLKCSTCHYASLYAFNTLLEILLPPRFRALSHAFNTLLLSAILLAAHSPARVSVVLMTAMQSKL
jgi:hypothetical protein